MTPTQAFAGIPITLPGWTEVATYIFLALMALAIAVSAWRAFVAHKNQPKLDEIHAKTNMILLILRGIQQDVDPEDLQPEHYYADEPVSDQTLVQPRGAHAMPDNEVTLDHGKLIK